MPVITIDKKGYEVQAEIAEFVQGLQDQNTFYRKVLGWIAWSQFQGPGLSLENIVKLAEESVRLYR